MQITARSHGLVSSASGRSTERAAGEGAIFPLHVARGKRYLVDATGAPFLLNGDTAWSLIVQLKDDDLLRIAESLFWLAQSLVTQANIALENALLFSQTDEQLQKRVNELAGLQRISNELNSTLDLNHLLNIVLEEAIRATQADAVPAFFIDMEIEGDPRFP